MTPRVSVIIPCRNHLATLNRAVKSAWACNTAGVTVSDVIVVDDGSLPRVADGAYHLLRTSNTELATGVCYARTKGILDAPRDSLILPLDADDELIPEGVAALVKAWQPNTFTYGAHIENGQSYPPAGKNAIGMRDLTGVTFLFSREDFIKAGGYNPDFNLGCEGWALQIALTKAGITPVAIPEPVYVYHRSDGGRMDRTRWLMPLIKQLMNYHYGLIHA